ncbi:proteasome regulatory particle base subunit [Blyttiomyces sp. JEL0837]|nr:proteasome regulatory particle base subunit [Blyttiomyces sp. JEL0837]
MQSRSLSLLASVLLCLIGAVLSASIGDVQVVVAGKDGKKQTVSASYPKSLDRKLQLNAGDVLQVSFKDSEGDADAFLAFTKSGESHFEATQLFEKQKGKLTSVLDVSKANILDSIGGGSGDYSITIFVAGLSTKETLKHQLGSVHVTMDESKVHHSEFSPRPVIKHVFRPSEKMPNVVISYFFSLAVIAPWAFLLLAWGLLRANIGELTTSSGLFVWGWLFAGSLSVSLYLFFLYWWQLNLFELLQYGSLLWGITAVLGRQALIARATKRTKGL